MNWLCGRKLFPLAQKYIYSMATFSPVTHVIFDLDGTILDTETLYTESYKTVLASYGKIYDNNLRLQITGKVERDTTRIIVETLGLNVPLEELNFKICEHQLKLLPNAQLKPGAEKLIKHLWSNNVPLSIATSSSIDKCKVKLAKHQELFGYFHHMVTGSSDPEVLNGKPAPDIFLICANRYPTPPEPSKCLVFEDAYNGVLAGKAAGMQVVMIPEDYVPEEMTKDADLTIKSLEDFKPEDFGLPPYP